MEKSIVRAITTLSLLDLSQARKLDSTLLKTGLVGTAKWFGRALIAIACVPLLVFAPIAILMHICSIVHSRFLDVVHEDSVDCIGEEPAVSPAIASEAGLLREMETDVYRF